MSTHVATSRLHWPAARVRGEVRSLRHDSARPLARGQESLLPSGVGGSPCLWGVPHCLALTQGLTAPRRRGPPPGVSSFPPGQDSPRSSAGAGGRLGRGPFRFPWPRGQRSGRTGHGDVESGPRAPPPAAAPRPRPARQPSRTIMAVPTEAWATALSPSDRFSVTERPSSTVSADRRFTSSPVCVLSKKATSCRSIAVNSETRSRFTMRWPAEHTVGGRPAGPARPGSPPPRGTGGSEHGRGREPWVVDAAEATVT